MTSGATLTASTKQVEDTNASYDASDVGRFLRVISSTPSFTGATGEITAVASSTVIELSFATAGNQTIVDATAFKYVIYDHPIAFFGDNGTASFNIGSSSDAKFEVHIPEGTGFHGFLVDDAAGVDQHQAATIDMDGKSYDGVVGLNVFGYSSVPATGKSMINTLLEIDGTNVTDGYATFLEMGLIGQPTDSTTTAINIDPNVTYIITMGTVATIDSAYYYRSGTATSSDVTAEFLSTASDTALWETDNDIVYICDDATFDYISFDFDTTSNRNLRFTYSYPNGAWATLLGMTDTTNGAKTSGSMSFNPPTDWVATTTDINGNAFKGIGTEYCIGITRTRNNVSRDPIENIVGIVGSANTFHLDAEHMFLSGITADPCGDAIEYPAGTIFYNTTKNVFCFCNGSDDLEIHDNSACF